MTVDRGNTMLMLIAFQTSPTADSVSFFSVLLLLFSFKELKKVQPNNNFGRLSIKKKKNYVLQIKNLLPVEHFQFFVSRDRG